MNNFPISSDNKTIPPTLGSVMLLCLWRYFVLPAISIAIVHGCQMRLPVKVFSRDPVFVSTSGKAGLDPGIAADSVHDTLGLRAGKHRHQPAQHPSTCDPSSRLHSPHCLRSLHYRLCRFGLQYLDPWYRHFIREQL